MSVLNLNLSSKIKSTLPRSSKYYNTRGQAHLKRHEVYKLPKVPQWTFLSYPKIVVTFLASLLDKSTKTTYLSRIKIRLESNDSL
jgi:hypothetical protein